MPNYVDKAIFHDLLMSYKLRKSRKVYNQIGRIFIEIAQRFSRYPRFINYSSDLKAEMESSSLYVMCKYMDNYDPKKGDPFSYFTMFCYNCCLQVVYQFYKDRDMFTSYTFLENLDDNFTSKDLMRKYKELPKTVEGDLKSLLKDIEDIDKIEIPDCKKESDDE